MISFTSLQFAALLAVNAVSQAPKFDITVPYTKDNGAHKSIKMLSVNRLDRSAKPITANTTFRLQNGSLVSGKEYYDRLDKLEAKLNAAGYSLNTAPDRTTIGSFSVKPSDQKAASQKLQNTITTSGNSDTFKAESFRSKPIIQPQPGSQNGFVNPQYFGHSYRASVNPGISEFGVHMDWLFAAQGTQLHDKRDTKKTKLDFDLLGQFHATGYAWDHQTNLVDASFAASCGETQPASFSVGLTLAGNKLIDFHRSVADTWSDGDTYAYPVDESYDMAFSLLPGIILRGKVGIMGQAGVKYSLSLSPTHLHGNATPFVYAKVYAQAGAGIGLAVDDLAVGVEAGLKASVTLIDESLPCDLDFGFVLVGPNHMGRGLLSTLSVKDHTNLFSGQLTGYVSEDLGFKTIEQDFPIFDFSGLTFDTTVFERSGFIKL